MNYRKPLAAVAFIGCLYVAYRVFPRPEKYQIHATLNNCQDFTLNVDLSVSDGNGWQAVPPKEFPVWVRLAASPGSGFGPVCAIGCKSGFRPLEWSDERGRSRSSSKGINDFILFDDYSHPYPRFLNLVCIKGDAPFWDSEFVRDFRREVLK